MLPGGIFLWGGGLLLGGRDYNDSIAGTRQGVLTIWSVVAFRCFPDPIRGTNMLEARLRHYSAIALWNWVQWHPFLQTGNEWP